MALERPRAATEVSRVSEFLLLKRSKAAVRNPLMDLGAAPARAWEYEDATKLKPSLMHELRSFYDLEYRSLKVREALKEATREIGVEALFAFASEEKEASSDDDRSDDDDATRGSDSRVSKAALVEGIRKLLRVEVRPSDLDGASGRNTISSDEFQNFVFYGKNETWRAEAIRRDPEDRCNDLRLLKRDSIRYDPVVLHLLRAFWIVCDKDGSGYLDKDEYVDYYTHLYASLNVEETKNAHWETYARSNAEKEWINDTAGHDTLDQNRFQISLFQIVDAYVDGEPSKDKVSKFLCFLLDLVTVDTQEEKNSASLQGKDTATSSSKDPRRIKFKWEVSEDWLESMDAERSDDAKVALEDRIESGAQKILLLTPALFENAKTRRAQSAQHKQERAIDIILRRLDLPKKKKKVSAKKRWRFAATTLALVATKHDDAKATRQRRKSSSSACESRRKSLSSSRRMSSSTTSGGGNKGGQKKHEVSQNKNNHRSPANGVDEAEEKKNRGEVVLEELISRSTPRDILIPKNIRRRAKSLTDLANRFDIDDMDDDDLPDDDDSHADPASVPAAKTASTDEQGAETIPTDAEPQRKDDTDHEKKTLATSASDKTTPRATADIALKKIAPDASAANATKLTTRTTRAIADKGLESKAREGSETRTTPITTTTTTTPMTTTQRKAREGPGTENVTKPTTTTTTTTTRGIADIGLERKAREGPGTTETVTKPTTTTLVATPGNDDVARGFESNGPALIVTRMSTKSESNSRLMEMDTSYVHYLVGHLGAARVPPSLSQLQSLFLCEGVASFPTTSAPPDIMAAISSEATKAPPKATGSSSRRRSTDRPRTAPMKKSLGKGLTLELEKNLPGAALPGYLLSSTIGGSGRAAAKTRRKSEAPKPSELLFDDVVLARGYDASRRSLDDPPARARPSSALPGAKSPPQQRRSYGDRPNTRRQRLGSCSSPQFFEEQQPAVIWESSLLPVRRPSTAFAAMRHLPPPRRRSSCRPAGVGSLL